MAHFLDNDWRLFIIKFPATGGTPTIIPDGTIHLSHSSANQLDDTSKHGSNDLSGNSRPEGGGFEIQFSEKVPAGDGAFKHRPFTGHLMDHKLENGVQKKVIGGFRGGLLDVAPNARDFESRDALGQNDGIWVATQP